MQDQPTNVVAFRPRPTPSAPAVLPGTTPLPGYEWPIWVIRLWTPNEVAAVLVRTPVGNLLTVDSALTERAAWLAVGMALGESRKARAVVVVHADVAAAEKSMGVLRALPWPSAGGSER